MMKSFECSKLNHLLNDLSCWYVYFINMVKVQLDINNNNLRVRMILTRWSYSIVPLQMTWWRVSSTCLRGTRKLVRRSCTPPRILSVETQLCHLRFRTLFWRQPEHLKIDNENISHSDYIYLQFISLINQYVLVNGASESSGVILRTRTPRGSGHVRTIRRLRLINNN